MKKNIENNAAFIENINEVFYDNICMDTQTRFHTDGHIQFKPCPWERSVVVAGSEKKFQASVSVREDGETLIRPYRKGTGSRYEKLFEIPYACVKQTSHDLIVNIRLPRKLGIRRIVTMMSEIFVAVTAFVGGDVKEAPSSSPEGGRVPMRTRGIRTQGSFSDNFCKILANLPPPPSGRSGGASY